MLRKIELRLNYLLEARTFISEGQHRKELDQKEKDLHNERKKDNI